MTTGIVQEVRTRQVQTKFGMKPVYDLVINNTKYGWGFKSPTSLGIGVGTEITFGDSPPDKYGPKIDPATVTVTGQNKTPPAKANGATGHTPSYRDRGGFPVSKASGEFAIIRQNALTNARELCSDVWNCVPGFEAPKTMDAMVEEVIRVANIFADYSSGQREVKAAEKITKKHGGRAAKTAGDIDATVSSMLLTDVDADAVEDEAETE